MDQVGKTLTRQLAGFVQLLRQRGVTVGTNQLLTWLRALEVVEWKDPETFFQVAQSALLNREDDRIIFRQVFLEYWLDGERANQPSASAEMESTTASTPKKDANQGEQTDSRSQYAGEVSDKAGAEEVGLYSAREILTQKDFGALTETERNQIEELIRNFQLNLGTFKTRRYRAGNGDRLDLRASLRHNLRFGGEWLHWDERTRKQAQRPLVVLADISGSMQTYSRMSLLFVHSLARGYQASVEVFLFGTRLTRVTQALQAQPPEKFLNRIANLTPDWSGGTRIGQSLESFHFQWARRVLNRRPIVIIISDGWDRGSPGLLEKAMARLQRSSASLIWLNPWLGSERFQPRTRGMVAALPYIDYFMPVHNLSSLQDLGDLLSQISMRSPGMRKAEPLNRMRSIAV